MSKQYVDVGSKWKKSTVSITMCVTVRVRDNILTVQRSESEEMENGFLDSHVTPDEVPN